MKIYRDAENARLPEFATEGSACFDLRAHFEMGDKIRAYTPHNRSIEIPPKIVGGIPAIQLHSSFRTLIPTGLIFDIPKNHEVKIYIRSSMALKYGIMLANGVAVIDSDYVDPAFVLVYNASDTPVTIFSGDRVAQAQLVALKPYDLVDRKSKPEKKTDREGGLGSTGQA
jgi:dUTP pyrophosphatase